MSDEKVFVDGMRVYKPSAKAPDYIIANGSIAMRDLIEWAKQHHTDGEVRFVIKESQKGNYYAQLDTFTPTRREQYDNGMQQARQAAEPPPPPPVNDLDDDVPF